MEREWMYGCMRSSEYRNGVKEFILVAKDNMLREGKNDTYCPCINCGNLRMFPPRNIEFHLMRKGFMKGYTCWSKHGEVASTVADEDVISDEEANDMPFNVDRADCFMPNEMVDDDEDDEMMPHLDELLRDYEGNEHNDRGYKDFIGLTEAAEKPLYPDCKEKYTKLSSVLELLKLKASSGMSDKSFNELLTLFADMLPEGNELPKNTYRAKKVLCPIGLEVERIHACRNDCILYRKQYAELESCPVCGASRFKNKSTEDHEDEEVQGVRKGIPEKVCWYLPVIPRLKRLFANPKEAKQLRWHAEERKVTDGKLRHPADAIQWKKINDKYKTFSDDPRNIRFGLSTDGMNPFGNMSSKHSTWPVLLCIYNLPPWLCMKRKYILMSILIEGPKQPGNDIDTYFQPLVDDLQTMWNEGVQVWDSYKREYFSLKSLLFCTIQDFPALGNTSGQTVKGHKGCVICIENTMSIRLKHYGKVVFMGHRRFLPICHPYRRMKKQFNGKVENGAKPIPFTGEQIWEKVKDVNVILGKGNKKKTREETPFWKKKSIFWSLPYWKDLDVRHCIDVMHIEKNVCDSVLGLLLNIKGKTKDGIKARLDMVDMNIRPELAPVVKPNGKTCFKPGAYHLSKAEKRQFFEFLNSVKVSSGYSANIRKLVSMKDLKLMAMKSHDCHVMMTEMLPIAIRNILPPRRSRSHNKSLLLFQ